MAQNNPYELYDDPSLFGDMNMNPEGPAPQGWPIPGGNVQGGIPGGGTPDPNVIPKGPSGVGDINALYKQILGRDMDQTEISTEPENVGKYGIDQLISNLQDRARNRGGGDGGKQPTSGGGGNNNVFAGPQQDVGKDAFSQAITNKIQEIIDNGGRLSPQAMAQRYEASKATIDRGRKSQLDQITGSLAQNNLLSVPGIAQGTDLGARLRLDERLSPAYAQAGLEALNSERDMAEQRLIAGLGLGNQRQDILGRIAVDTLNQNRQWNQFLAQFGLDREKAMYEIQNGGVDQLLPLLQFFQNNAAIAARGQA